MIEITDNQMRIGSWLISIAIVIACVFMNGCSYDEEDEEDERLTIADVVVSSDGEEYIIYISECTDKSAIIEIELNNEAIYSGERYCIDGLPIYKTSHINHTLYATSNPDVVDMRIYAEGWGSLCSLGDLIITFSDVDYEPITINGVHDCNRYLARVDIPYGDYRGTVEFFSYSGDYDIDNFTMNMRNIEGYVNE
jgi:hypothetical protein